MEKTRLTTESFKDAEVESGKLANTSVAEAKLKGNAVTTGKITDGTVAAADLSSTLDLSSKTLSLPEASFNTSHYNIALLGFKMAVTENLTVFNLVDGVVDEFHDESGTGEGEGSNDTYCGTNDNYINTQPSPTAISAGFSTTAITEPGPSTAGTNPEQDNGQTGVFTVPTGMTSINYQLWGAGGAGAANAHGGGGGYTEGALAVTATQSIYVAVGEGGIVEGPGTGVNYAGGAFGGGCAEDCAQGGGGGTHLIAQAWNTGSPPTVPSAPQIYGSAGAGGGASRCEGGGGAGGGLVGCAGSSQTEQTSNRGDGVSHGAGQMAANAHAGGGDQEQGGQGGAPSGQCGSFLGGGSSHDPTDGGGGGGGFYGGGGGSAKPASVEGAGGGGSSYYGHPQVTSGSTEEGASQSGGYNSSSGGVTQPGYVAGVGAGGLNPTRPGNSTGADGYVLLTGTALNQVTASTTIVSNAFTAGSAPTSSRIVVFQETASGSPTLNTDIVAAVSRNGGSNFSNVTLVDEGYVTGASGQRVLAGLVDISGQPSGTSMRWKLTLANNQSKIHGVSLSWG